LAKKKFSPFLGTLDFVGSGNTVSNQNEITMTASENISALKYVYADSPSTVSISKSTNGKKPIGIAKTSATAGNQLTVVTFGQFSDLDFDFGSDNIFLGSNGYGTQIPASSGYHIVVARGMGSGKIFVDIDDVIKLA
jgi:hypothetical protein